jgi:metal-responsive CopG/Arc/MetJ family transcriptional regulator
MKGVIMRTIQMTLDNDLVKRVDDIVNELKTTRSAFTRDALWEAVKQYNIRRLELMHRQGYAAHPVNREEFSIWEKEQNWGDE